MTHIVFVANTAYSMWNFRRDVLRGLIADGHRITCFVTEDRFVESLKSIGVNIELIPLSRSGINPVAEMKLLFTLYILLRKHAPQLVISYTIKPNSYVPLLAKKLSIPSVAVVTGLGYAYLQKTWKAMLGRALLKMGLKRATNIWFLNSEDAEMIAGQQSILRDKSHILPGEGIDTNEFNDVSYPAKKHPPFIFLMVARLLKDKGVMEYAAAAKIVREHNPNVICQIAGGLDPQNPAGIDISIWQQICALGHITYLGELKDIKDIKAAIAAADACVLPSYREGIPFALLEAGAMRRPLVATDVAGCRDVVIDGVTGFLCEPRSAQSLADSMTRMIDLSTPAFSAMKEAVRNDICARFEKTIVMAHYREFIKKYAGSV